MNLFLLIFYLIYATNAVECSTIEQLEVPSTNTFTTSKQIVFSGTESSPLSLNVCVHNATKPIQVKVYDSCNENTFTDMLMSFETEANCDESLPIEIIPEKNHYVYLDIIVTESVEYQISISLLSTEESKDAEDTNIMKTYGKYIIVGICLVCVGLVAILLAIIASRKHKKDEESKYQEITQ